MVRNVSTFAVMLVLASWATGAPPKVPTGAIGQPGRETVVEIESPKPGESVAWREAFSPNDCFVGEMKPLRADTIRLLFIPRKPGVYAVVVWSGLTREDSASLVLDATSGVIPDKKEPDKVDPVIPPPKPAQVTGKQFVVVIQDRLRADPNQATALASNVFREWLRVGGHEFEVIDTSTAEGAARAAKYRPAFTSFRIPEGTPVVVLQQAEANQTRPKGWVGAMIPIPGTGEALTESLRSATGK